MQGHSGAVGGVASPRKGVLRSDDGSVPPPAPGVALKVFT